MAKDVQNRPHGAQPSPRQLAAGQRKRAYVRMRRQKRRRLVSYILAFLAVVAVAVALCLTVLFRITSIEVAGATRYAAEELIQASGIQKGQNLFLADVGGAPEKIQSKHPYLSAVKVSRRLPARIVIEVQDASVACVAEWDGKFLLLDSEGRVLELAAKAPDGAPVCKGMQVKSAAVGEKVVLQDENQLGLFSQVAQAVKDSGLSGTSAVDLSDAYNLKVVCSNKAGKQMTLKLGNANYLGKKLRFAKATIDQKLADSEAGTFDLSLITQEKSLTFFQLDPAQQEPAASSSAASSSSQAESEGDGGGQAQGGTGDGGAESGGGEEPSNPYQGNSDYIDNGDGTYTDLDGDTFKANGEYVGNVNEE